MWGDDQRYQSHGIVLGRWEIDQYEPDCNTYWNWYKDKAAFSRGITSVSCQYADNYTGLHIS